MTGMCRYTGKALSEHQHIAQSIADILTTPVGSRLLRRSYGSLIPELLDGPLNPEMRLRVMSAAIDAVTRWEKRILIQAIHDIHVHEGRLMLSLAVIRVRDGHATLLDVTA